MVRITQELVRKRSEHNDGDICSLEEISLHQEDIEAIELLQHWCKDLRILLLQSNLISKLENLSKLKKLEYLNLALNNIERIENLEGCESLQKLDLTLNFIGELTSVRSLRKNEFLRDLYLTGNPCTDYTGYRDYVVASLPQLTALDGREVERSERIRALQVYEEARRTITSDQRRYLLQRLAQKESKKGCVITEIDDEEDERPEEERVKDYWAQECDNSPETRVEIANTIRRQNEKAESKPKEIQTKRVYRFFNDQGRPLNINEAKIDFTLTEDDAANCVVLDVAVYKHLDTSYIDVDIQPGYAKMLIKGKIFQIVFADEVKPDTSTAQRSLTTGHLVLRMPRVNGEIKAGTRSVTVQRKEASTPADGSKRELLEIGRSDNTSMDFSRIVEDSKNRRTSNFRGARKELPTDFVDNPEVPPLE